MFVLYVIHRIVIKPLLALRYYKSQGIHTDYFPPIGHPTLIQRDFIEKGCSFALPKHFAKTQPNMPLRAINFVDNVMIALNSPELLKEYFRNHSLYAKCNYFVKPLRLVAGLGILTSEGAHWKKHRKIISNFFHYNFFVDCIPLIRDVVVEFYEDMKQKPLNNVHIMDEIQSLSGEIIGRIFFTERLYDQKCTQTGRPIQLEIAYLIGDLSSEARTLIPALFGSQIIAKGIFKNHRDILSRRAEVIKIVETLIEKRRKSGENKNDMLDLLLRTQQEPDPANRLTDQDIIDEFFTFIGAGVDTTGHLFTMCLYSLMRHPELAEGLRQEREKLYNTKNPDHESLKNMDLLTAFIKECLRMYSPVPAPMPMEAIKTHKLGQYTIKEGTIIRPDYFFNNFNERYFKDPYKFDPSRWFEKEVQALDPYVFIPFSSGSRNCIGQHLAMIEAKIMLCEFLNRFDYKCSVENYNPKMAMRMLYEPIPEYFIDLTLKE